MEIYVYRMSHHAHTQARKCQIIEHNRSCKILKTCDSACIQVVTCAVSVQPCRTYRVTKGIVINAPLQSQAPLLHPVIKMIFERWFAMFFLPFHSNTAGASQLYAYLHHSARYTPIYRTNHSRG